MADRIQDQLSGQQVATRALSDSVSQDQDTTHSHLKILVYFILNLRLMC